MPFLIILESFDVLLVLKYYIPNWNFSFYFCSFRIWRLLLQFSMISTTIDPISPNIAYCWMISFRYVQTIAISCVSGWWVLSLWEPNICVYSLLMAEHSTFWCIAIFHRDEELNSQKTIQEEDPKNKSSLEIREDMHLFPTNRLSNCWVARFGIAT